MITLDLTPKEEAQIYRLATKVGLPPSEYAKRLVKEHLPLADATGFPTADPENSAAIAQLQAWLREEGTSDAEEVRRAEMDLQELHQNLNQNRVESGESPLFP